MRQRGYLRYLPALLVLALALPAGAHNGPPFPIIEDRKLGPFIVALWTHPDIGVGTFWVMVDPAPGAKIPKDLKVEIAIQPVNGRIPERRYAVPPDDSSNQVQFKVEVPFDRQEFVRARVFLKSSQGVEQAAATVEVTPVGFGRWDLLLYMLPFLGVGFLWFRAMTRGRKRGAAR